MANHLPKGVEHMLELGRLGGVISSQTRARRFSNLERRLLGVVAARARWRKTKWSSSEEVAWREGWLAGAQYMSGWPRDRRKNRVFIEPTDGHDRT